MTRRCKAYLTFYRPSIEQDAVAVVLHPAGQEYSCIRVPPIHDEFCMYLPVDRETIDELVLDVVGVIVPMHSTFGHEVGLLYREIKFNIEVDIAIGGITCY